MRGVHDDEDKNEYDIYRARTTRLRGGKKSFGEKRSDAPITLSVDRRIKKENEHFSFLSRALVPYQEQNENRNQGCSEWEGVTPQ
jgi:hypothetical protein